MSTVPETLTNGKLAPEHIDWLTGAEISPDLVTLDPDFEGPTPEEEREGAEIMATLHLDSFMPRRPSFKCFLAEQARLAKIRDNDRNWEWLSNLLTEHAARALFMKARTPQEYDERVEVLSRPVGANHDIQTIRTIAGLLDTPFKSLAPELLRVADRLERIIGARS